MEFRRVLVLLFLRLFFDSRRIFSEELFFRYLVMLKVFVFEILLLFKFKNCRVLFLSRVFVNDRVVLFVKLFYVKFRFLSFIFFFSFLVRVSLFLICM